MRRMLNTVLLGSMVTLGLAGCSASSAAWTGMRLGKNLAKNNSFLRVKLDGQEAKQNKVKKAASGYAEWKIKEPVSTSPKLEYTITDPEKMGRITMVTVSIFQAFRGDYSHQADFTILAVDTNNPDAQMKEGVEYDLSNPGEGFKILDVTSKEIDTVKMTPGMKYKAMLTVKADKSQTAIIYFETT